MLQRLQTIWLLLAGALGLISLKTAFFTGHRINDAIPKPMVFATGSYNILLIVATTAAAFASLIAIFLYKNRKFQLRLTIVSILLSMGTILLYFWQKQAFIPEESSYSLTALIPLVIPVLQIMAARGIYRDEQIVKSADRLR